MIKDSDQIPRYVAFFTPDSRPSACNASNAIQISIYAVASKRIDRVSSFNFDATLEWPLADAKLECHFPEGLWF